MVSSRKQQGGGRAGQAHLNSRSGTLIGLLCELGQGSVGSLQPVRPTGCWHASWRGSVGRCLTYSRSGLCSGSPLARSFASTGRRRAHSSWSGWASGRPSQPVNRPRRAMPRANSTGVSRGRRLPSSAAGPDDGSCVRWSPATQAVSNSEAGQRAHVSLTPRLATPLKGPRFVPQGWLSLGRQSPLLPSAP
jgi:hypothetical protein